MQTGTLFSLELLGGKKHRIFGVWRTNQRAPSTLSTVLVYTNLGYSQVLYGEYTGRMQIWRITRSAPGKSHMKTRLVSLLSSGSIYEHKNFYGGWNKVHQIDDKARLSWGSAVKTEHLSLASLVFTQLVPGDDRLVRHICIWCIFAHVTRLDQSRANENIWWIIINN